jgi:hypothetical protein
MLNRYMVTWLHGYIAEWLNNKSRRTAGQILADEWQKWWSAKGLATGRVGAMLTVEINS